MFFKIYGYNINCIYKEVRNYFIWEEIVFKKIIIVVFFYIRFYEKIIFFLSKYCFNDIKKKKGKLKVNNYYG